jgi:hypothetical protein
MLAVVAMGFVSGEVGFGLTPPKTTTVENE